MCKDEVEGSSACQASEKGVSDITEGVDSSSSESPSKAPSAPEQVTPEIPGHHSSLSSTSTTECLDSASSKADRDCYLKIRNDLIRKVQIESLRNDGTVVVKLPPATGTQDGDQDMGESPGGADGAEISDAKRRSRTNAPGAFRVSMSGSELVTTIANLSSATSETEADDDYSRSTSSKLDGGTPSDKREECQMVTNSWLAGSNILIEDDVVSVTGTILKRIPTMCFRSWVGTFAFICFLLVLVMCCIHVAMNQNRTQNDGVPHGHDHKQTHGDGHTRAHVPEYRCNYSNPTLKLVTDRGYLRCGSTKLEFQIGVDLCHALAAAALGDKDLVEIIDVGSSWNYAPLADGEVDVLTGFNTPTMENEVFRTSESQGFSYSTPYLFHNIVLSGEKEAIECIDENWDLMLTCTNLNICIERDSTVAEMLRMRFAGNQLTVFSSEEEQLMGFMNGECNAIPERSWRLRQLGYTGTIVESGNVLLRLPYALVTRWDSDQWSDFVNWVLQALLVASEKGITQATASSFGSTSPSFFGYEHQNMFIHAIDAVGNYQEISERMIAATSGMVEDNSRGLNRPNQGTSGLMYSTPMGRVSSLGPDAMKGMTLELISNRKKMRCGVRGNRPGFAYVWNETIGLEGLDVDFCMMLAVSILSGDETSLELVEVEDDEAAFLLLKDGGVDVVAGMMWNLERDVHEDTTHIGYTFSKPYFYDTSLEEGSTMRLQDENLCLMTMEGDHQWSSFVNWIVEGTMYAEMQRIEDFNSANDMPLVRLFGPAFDRMFPDAIARVYGYQCLYFKNLEEIIPRSGRNLHVLLNASTPLMHPLPGL